MTTRALALDGRAVTNAKAKNEWTSPRLQTLKGPLKD